MEQTKSGDFIVPIAGHSKELRFTAGVCQCGGIKDGVAFEFAGEGGWLMTLAEQARSNVKVTGTPAPKD